MFFSSRICTGSQGERGLSFMVIIALTFVSIIIVALIGILSSVIRTSAQHYHSYTNEAICRSILLEIVEPVLEDEGWPHLPIHSWMEPCETPERCSDQAHEVSFNHQKYRLNVIPTPEKTYIVTVFDVHRHLLCDSVHFKPTSANYLEPLF